MSGLATKSLLRSSFTGSGGMIQPNDIKSAANILIQQSGGPGLSGNRRLEEFHINLATRLANDSRVQDIYCEHLYDETWERPASQSLKDTEEFCAHKREAIRQMLNQVEHYIGESKIIQEEIKVLEDREAHPAVSTAGFELSTTETKYSDSPQNISKAVCHTDYSYVHVSHSVFLVRIGRDLAKGFSSGGFCRSRTCEI